MFTIDPGGTPRSYVSDGQRVTSVPLTIKRRSNRKLLIPPAHPSNASPSGGYDEPMIRMLAKAFHWQRLIDQGRFATIAELSSALKMEQGWAAEVIRMTTLAPDIVTAIVKGQQPRQLNLQLLRGRVGGIPRDWAEQRRLFGFTDA
ncbi:hypothetical protein [Caldimonas sp.]|uniref:hypothetical protein n=1 Tax=Caldimonas sp. TaxID=2838790 RepID=UPI00391A8995